MKKNIILTTAALLLFASCSDNKQASNGSSSAPTSTEFRSQTGDIVATRTINGTDTTWTFTNSFGEALIPGTDSLQVLSSYQEGQPKEVIFHHKGQSTMIVFYKNMNKQVEGDLKNGLYNGHVTGYDEGTGRKLSESDYIEGIQHGSFISYNANGTPSIIGHYDNGNPVGEWTFYDKEGIIIETQKK